MTLVTLIRTADSLDLCVQGHAGSTDKSPDPVCAAASMLVCALMERLERLRDQFCELHVGYESGRCEISARAEGASAARLFDSAEVAMCGFDLLAAAFPKSVAVRRGGDVGGRA